MMGLRRVVISGLGALTPIGNDVNTLWASLVDGVSGAGPITRFNAEKFKTKFACEVKGYDPLNFFDKKEVRKYDLFSQFGIVAADEAINDSGFKQGNYNPERVGVIWASGIGGIMTLTEEIRAYVTGDGTPRFSPFFIPKMISDITSGHIAIKHGFMGPNFFYCFSLCFICECHSRCFQQHSKRKGRYHYYRWVGGFHKRSRNRWV